MKSFKINIIIINQFIKLIDLQNKNIKTGSSSNRIIKYSIANKNYNHAISVIKNLNFELESTYQLKNFNLSHDALDKINYILNYPDRDLPSIIRLEEKRKKYGISSTKLYKQLIKIFGTKGKTIINYIDKYNITSLPTLICKIKSGQIKVDNKIKASLYLHKKYKINIPHDEITLIGDMIKSILYYLDKNLSITICGSYRREHGTSNDIDLIITHKKYKTQEKIKKSMLMKLIINNISKYIKLHDAFKFTNEEYIGLCKYGKQPSRRIDIILVSIESYPTALLFYTGSYTFNRFIRYLAALNNYKITEFGLFQDKKRFLLKNEMEIFKKLNIKYIEPRDREPTYIYENYLYKEEHIEAFNYASWYK